MNFHGAARRLDDEDLPRVGARIGVGEDEIHAVLDVETAGSGFDRQGRPAMLFEPHIFWRELRDHPAVQAEAARQGLAYRRWGEQRYPSDSYPRLAKALALCEANGLGHEPALRSASWGLGQIMGFNAELAGYASASDMVTDFLDDEERHLDAMVTFIEAVNLDDELRAHDWRGFARGYNGAGYARHGYHTRLEQRFTWWSEIRDTPWQRPADDVRRALEVARWDDGDRMAA